MSGTAVCPTCGAPVGASARFCASCGSQLGAELAEERKLATIVFADVMGSTDLGDQLDPERVRALLSEYFAAMSSVVTTWGGTIEKYIGDAILAVWGVPTAREDDPIRALHAVREMIAEIDRLNGTFEHRHGVQLRVRIGVNTGEVLAPVGARPGGQFLVSGDAVNVASRLEQAAEPGTAMVGERTWSSARHAFKFGEPLSLPIRGKRDLVVARVLGTLLSSDAQRTPFQGAMVGRDRELATVIGLLDEAIEGASPRLVLIAGPAGMGKSRLLRETISEAGERFDRLLVLRGRCLAAGHGITFWALGEILRAACSISLDEPADRAIAKLEQSVAGPLAAIGLGIEDIARTAAALATSANLTLPDNLLEGLDPELVFEEIARAWPRFLTGLARTWPLAIVIEDIHWADDKMLTLIEMLAARSQGPILIVATARPEFLEARPGFGTGQDVSVVSLRPLTGAQSERLIDELIGSAGLPPHIVEEIRAKAEGNPFFLEEMLQRLVDEGALVNDNGSWRATERAASVKLSDNIHSLLAARIDALPVQEKQYLQEASVVGRIFWPGALSRDEALNPAAAIDVLNSLERRGLIAVRPTSTIDDQPEYMFRHMLIHDVAYGSVPKGRRARAHAAVGRWLETFAHDRRDEYQELIAYHLSTAIKSDGADLAWSDRDDERESIRVAALEALRGAGSSARHRFAIDKALQLHQEAVDLASTPVEIAVVNEELGEDHEALFQGDEAVAAYLAGADGLAATSSREADEIRGRLVGKAGRMLMRWGAFHEKPPIERVQELVSESLATDTSDRTRALLLMAHGGLIRNEAGVPIGAGGAGRIGIAPEAMQERIASIRGGLQIAQALDDIELIYMGNDLLYVAYQTVRDYPRLRAVAEEQAGLLGKLNSVSQQVDSLVALASAREDEGSFADALRAGEEAFRRSAALNAHERMHAAYPLLSAAERLGDWDRVAEVLPWFAQAAHDEGNVTCPMVRGGPALGATVLARRGEMERARSLVPIWKSTETTETFLAAAHMASYASFGEDHEAAIDLARSALANIGNGFMELGVLPLIDALVRLQMFDELERFLTVAEPFSESAATIPPVIERARGLLAARKGDVDGATRSLRLALARFESLGISFEIAQTQEMLANLVEEPERSSLRRAARDAYEDLGAKPFADRLRSTVRSPVS